MKLLLALVMLALGGLFGKIAYNLDHINFWPNFLLNIAASSLEIGLALVIINIYLEKAHKKDAVKAILAFTISSIADLHNTYLALVFEKFGKSEFDNLTKTYISEKGDIKSIKPEERDKLYDAIRSNSTKLKLLIEQLDKTMSEMTNLVGWDLDPFILANALGVRTAIREYSVSMDLLDKKTDGLKETREEKDNVVEHLIDCDLHIQMVISALADIGGHDRAQLFK